MYYISMTKYIKILLMLAVVSATMFGFVGCKTSEPKEKYAGTLTDLKWESDKNNYITWGGNQSMFPAREDNLSGIIVIVKPNGEEVPCEYFRPGYRRQHLNNAYGNDGYAVKGVQAGQTVQVYMCALTPNLKADKTLRTNPMPLVWRNSKR